MPPWPRLRDPGPDGVPLVLVAMLGMLPWFALMAWATYRGTGLFLMDEDLMAEYDVREPPLVVAFALLLAGWAACVLGAIYAVTSAFVLLGLPPEGRAFDMWLFYAFGNAAVMPPAALHLWTTRHLWRHGGLYARTRRESAW